MSAILEPVTVGIVVVLHEATLTLAASCGQAPGHWACATHARPRARHPAGPGRCQLTAAVHGQPVYLPSRRSQQETP